MKLQHDLSLYMLIHASPILEVAAELGSRC